MNWSKEKLVSRIEEVLRRIEIEKDNEELIRLKIDYMVFLEMLRVIDEHVYEKYKNIYYVEESYFSLHTNFTHDFELDSYQNAIEEKSRLIDVYRATDMLFMRGTKTFYSKKIKEEDYLKMVEEFFIGFDPELYKLYLKLFKDNINLTKERYSFSTAVGICYFDRLNNEPFVTAKFRSMKDATILPHEIGHAYQISQIAKEEDVSRYHVSSYRETYSKLIELIFIHENINGKYRHALLNQERTIYDELAVICDGYSNALFGIEDFDMEKGMLFAKHSKVPKCIIDDILSRSLAIYFYSIYLEDKNKFYELINTFNKNIARVSDRELTVMYSKDDIVNAISNAVRLFPRH